MTSPDRAALDYAPTGPAAPVVEAGDFRFAATHFDHGHINGQTQGLVSAGGTLTHIYEPRQEKRQRLVDTYPDAIVVDDFRHILDDDTIHLVTSAAVPCDRFEVGKQVLESGKDYLTDKAPFTTLDQLQQARQIVQQTGRKWMVCYSERLSSEASWHAGELIKAGAIGRVLQVLNLAPHNLAPSSRPDWFFQKEKYGGIITDIGSHQFEQFLEYAGASDGTINFARVDNLGNPDYPELEDFGEASLTMDNGVSCYCRIDWFNPGGLRSWGDGRTFVLGTTGSLEIRKNIDVARDTGGNRLFLVDGEKEHEIGCVGKVGKPWFGLLIRDVLDRTDHAMTQTHAFKAAELSLQAQLLAEGTPSA